MTKVLPVPQALLRGRVYHKPKGDPYAFGCNRATIRMAARKKGVVGIDLDFNPNKSLTPWVHHQLHPTKRDAWFDFKHVIGDKHSCRQLTDGQMNRLRVRYQGAARPILTAREAAIYCRDVKGGPLIPCFEAKFQHPCYLDPDWWYHEFVQGIPANCQVVIMALPGANNAGLKKLRAAKKAGLPTMWLWRGDAPITHTQGFKDAVDLIKSRPGRGIYRV